MNPRLRRAIAYVFITAFVVTTPLVLLWTAGYRFNWNRQRVQKTGILQVESEPKGAAVVLNGRMQKKTTPAALNRLLPEDYAVRVQKDGYLPWQKTLEVSSGRTTFATGIVLYRDVLPRMTEERSATATVWNQDATSAAYVTDDGERQEIGLHRAGGKAALLARFATATYANPALSWSPDGRSLLLTATTTDKDALPGQAAGANRVLRFSQDETVSPLAVHERFPKGALTAHWATDGSIAVVNAAGAHAVNADTGAATPLLPAKDVEDADVWGRTGYVLRPSAPTAATPVTLLQKTSDGIATTVAELPTGRYRFLPGNEPYLLVTDDRRGRMHAVNRNTGSVASFDATGHVWEPKGRRLLLWNDYEIAIANPEDGSRELVTRLGSAVLQCAWSPAGDGIIYSTPEGVSLAELDGRDHRNVFDLIRASDMGPFAVDAKAGILRFMGSIGSKRGFFEREF